MHRAYTRHEKGEGRCRGNFVTVTPLGRRRGSCIGKARTDDVRAPWVRLSARHGVAKATTTDDTKPDAEDTPSPAAPPPGRVLMQRAYSANNATNILAQRSSGRFAQRSSTARCRAQKRRAPLSAGARREILSLPERSAGLEGAAPFPCLDETVLPLRRRMLAASPPGRGSPRAVQDGHSSSTLPTRRGWGGWKMPVPAGVQNVL